MRSNFYDIFPKKKILLGMLHMEGKSSQEKIDRVFDEVRIYKEEGFDGAIVEDFHSGIGDAILALSVLHKESPGILLGVNILSDPYLSFGLADKYGAKFIQFDTIQASAGDEHNPKRFNEKLYMSLKKKYPHLCLFGGVRFKYIPETGKSLQDDLYDGMYKSDVIVTTGPSTGVETPLEKLKNFKEIMRNFPLFVGAGVNDRNIREQMKVANGAIVGSYIKGGNTHAKIIRENVRKLVDLVKG